MKKRLFNPKPLTKAEKIYMDQLAKRPADTIFREVFSKVHNYLANEQIKEGHFCVKLQRW